jgi:hypothetical protein
LNKTRDVAAPEFASSMIRGNVGVVKSGMAIRWLHRNSSRSMTYPKLKPHQITLLKKIKPRNTIHMNTKTKAVQYNEKIKKLYTCGILIFIGIFSTIAICAWFLSSLNF